MSNELTERVDKILAYSMPDRHTFFQIEKFIIGKEPTAQAQLWAIHRELQARNETRDNFLVELKNAEDQLELFDIKIERMDRQIKDEAQKTELFTDLNIKELEINIRKLQRDKELLVKSARKVKAKLTSLLEEMAFLVAGYEKIVQQHGPMKPLDDEESQREMWNEKLLEEFNLRMLFQQRLDSEFVKTVMCLHDEAPVKKQVVTLIEQIQRKMISDRMVKCPRVEPKAKITGK